MSYRDYIVFTKSIDERPASFVDYPNDLISELREFLQSKGINQLYSHQAEMFELVENKKNVVITTSTASGKTLSFLLPVLQEILKSPSTRAIFVYPTKALASDQYRAIKPFLDYFGKDKIYAGVYDGDTTVNERSELRKKANIILTNPEMINGAFLPNHSSFGFDFIFKNLKYIVFDELHTYRGAFGSHIANLMRRLDRICRYYNSSPQVLCSSATISNPLELAENIFGKKFSLVSKDGSPSSNKKYHIIEPPIDERTNFQMPTKDLIEPLIADLTKTNQSFIAFCESRKEVEIIVKETREKLKSENYYGDEYLNLISGYRGGYLPSERREIEQKMLSGKIVGLVSTNALELGIDIGKISTSILNGFPSTRASFWQQSGRAGRNGKNSSTYLVLKQKPIDQYIVSNPEWLFNTESENAVVDKDNLFIQLAHCRSAAAELPLSLDDISLFPNLSEILPVLISHNEIKQLSGKFVWCGASYPAGDYSLRNVDNERYKVINIESGNVLTEADKFQAYTQLYKGAIYIHDATTYEVLNLDTKNKTISVKKNSANFYTEPMVTTDVEILNVLKIKNLNRTKCKFADLNVKTVVNGFKKLQFGNMQNLGYVKLDNPLKLEMETEGVLLEIPNEVAKTLRCSSDEDYYFDVYKELAFSLETSSQMVTMTSIGDIGSAKTLDENKSVYVSLFDKYQGGLGFSEKIFELIEQIIDNSKKMLRGCKCKWGCPACIGTNQKDKEIVLWAIESLTDEQAICPVIRYRKSENPSIKKDFELEFLPENFEKLKQKFEQENEEFALFIKSINKVSVNGNNLTLYVKDNFTKLWIENETNLKNLKNALTNYVNVPLDFKIKIETLNDDNSDIELKINKRYKDIKVSTDE